ncbi:protein of unknown function [Xenorhabdus doucetiae]|uniref:Uncharacterized protein n=1 Tax=Xenorhabdus doucetiae TaxID=351671 RepID=A0A068QSC0_9GAMM|nr:protein of unknown function [Xenorhabdus doucetiae]
MLHISPDNGGVILVLSHRFILFLFLPVFGRREQPSSLIATNAIE